MHIVILKMRFFYVHGRGSRRGRSLAQAQRYCSHRGSPSSSLRRWPLRSPRASEVPASWLQPRQKTCVLPHLRASLSSAADRERRPSHLEQHRVVSVRECERSQGSRRRLCLLRQIGNAVPPTLAFALGMETRKAVATKNTKDYVVELDWDYSS